MLWYAILHIEGCGLEGATMSCGGGPMLIAYRRAGVILFYFIGPISL
jgi:hypothetical protein